MKPLNFFLALLLFIGFNCYSQTSTIKGKITDVKPKFAGQYALTVKKTELVLITDITDKTGQSFEINKEYKDILIMTEGDKYILNPKYANQSFKITYALNGKGWKCIKNLEPIKK